MRPAITAKQAETEHSHYPISLDDLAQALDHSDEGFALTDPEGNYVYINDAHLRMFGYGRPQELLGRSWRDLYTPEWVRYFEEAVLPVMPRDLVWRGQVLAKKRNGSPFPAGVTLTYLPDGKITCNCRDESAHRAPVDAHVAPRSEPDVRPALRALGERLAAGLPSKLRRPIDMLAGYSSFLLSELEAGHELAGDVLRSGLTEIDAAGRILAGEMRRLDFVASLSRPEARAGQEFCTASGNWPKRLIAACRGKAAAASRETDLQLVAEAAEVDIGYPALECVISELLANALESSRPGDAVQIAGRPSGDIYEFRVCDQGVGFPSGQFNFEPDRPFGQTSPCGFGLALVRHLLRIHGGTIAAESGGDAATTCLIVTLPLRR